MPKTKAAPARKIKGMGKLGSTRNIEKSLKSAGSNRSELIVSIPSKGVLNVRFLQEPTEFHNYYEYYDPEAKMSFPVVEGEDLPEDVRIVKRFIGNVYLPEEKKIRAVILPSSLFEQLFSRFQKWGTLMDRDYELSKTGTGLETKYLMDYEPPSRLPNASKLQAKILDLEEVLLSMLDDQDEDDEDDDDDEEELPRSTKKKSRRVVEEDDDDDEDEDDEDDEEDEPPARKRVVKKKTTPTKTLTKKKRIR